MHQRLINNTVDPLAMADLNVMTGLLAFAEALKRLSPDEANHHLDRLKQWERQIADLVDAYAKRSEQ